MNQRLTPAICTLRAMNFSMPRGRHQASPHTVHGTVAQVHLLAKLKLFSELQGRVTEARSRIVQ